MGENERHKNLINFILNERFITLTVLGSIFTFSFVGSFKADIVEPMMHFILPEENFGFMDITIRDGESIPMPTPLRIDLRAGNFFREFIIWLFLMGILFILAYYTKYPDHYGGNPGVAIM